MYDLVYAANESISGRRGYANGRRRRRTDERGGMSELRSAGRRSDAPGRTGSVRTEGEHGQGSVRPRDETQEEDGQTGREEYRTINAVIRPKART